MYRIAIEKLLKWKQSKRRKPLIIEGARQVGKTWLMKEFGKQAYTDAIYINFDSNSRMAELFASDLDTDRLIMGLELYAGRKMNRSPSSRQLKKYKFFLPVEIYLLAVFMQLASKFHVFPLALKFQDSFASVYCCSNLYNLRSFLREYLYQ